MFKPLVFLSALLVLTNCKNPEDNKSRNTILGLLLLNRTQSLGKGSQSIAEYFGDSSALTSEDAIESGASGSTGGTRSFSSTIESGTGTVTITNEELNCRLGGKIIFSGQQTFTVNSRISPQVFTLNLSGGSRKIQYENCKISPSLTINSGEINIEQTSPNTTLISEVSFVDGNTVIKRTLNNLRSTTKGTINVTLSGSRGSGTAEIQIDQTLTLIQRVREWSVSPLGRLRNPTLKSRQGSITGTITVNGNVYNINKSLDVNVEED